MLSQRCTSATPGWVEKVVWPLAEVEPYGRFGSEMAGGRYQDFEGMGAARDGQEHFPSEGFE